MSSTYKTIKGLTYGMSSCMSECGATESRKNVLYFPFFLIGGCGEDEAVISYNNEREVLVAPKNMNYQWFNLLANKLAANSHYDWDWESFSKNILKPNREHLKTTLKINDEKVDRLFEDGYVFINNFNKSPSDDGEDNEEWLQAVAAGEQGYYPNFKNFLEHDNLEY